MNRCLLLWTICGIIGCGNGKPTAPPGPPPPLTVEDWKTLPIEEKYDAGTFERLKDADPHLQAPKAWDRFMREVVVPERKRDIPGSS